MLALRTIMTSAVPLTAVCGLLLGCGLTTRNDRPSEPAPDAGVDANPDAAIDPMDPCVERPPLTERAENRAYPIAPRGDPPLLASVQSLRDPNCREYRLGEAIELPWGREDRLVFSFDVNGDSVADIFFENHQSLGLLESQIADGRVSYDFAGVVMSVDDFPSLRESFTIRFFARDINHDSVPDVVVGHGNSFWAFANLPGGFVEVMEHRASEDPRVGQMSFPGIAVGDFDGDGHCIADMALGYDAALGTIGSADGIEVGVLLLQARGSWPRIHYDARRWASQFQWYGDPEGEILYSGRIAANVQDGKASLFLQGGESGGPGLMVELGAGAPVEYAVEIDEAGLVWMMPFAGKRSALAVQHARDLVLYDLADPTATPLPELWRQSMHGELVTFEDHEGGGGGVGPFGYMIDLDGDGDLDFIEGTKTGAFWAGEGRRIVIHWNEKGERFADGVAVELPVGYDIYGAVEEHPFVASGEAQGAFLIGYGEPGGMTPTLLWPIECIP